MNSRFANGLFVCSHLECFFDGNLVLSCIRRDTHYHALVSVNPTAGEVLRTSGD